MRTKFAFIAVALLAAFSVSSQETAPSDDVQQVAAPHFPHEIQVEGATVTIYQPQVTAWDHRTLTAWVAVGVLTDGAKKPVMGAAEVTATTTADFNDRAVMIYNKQVQTMTFPGVAADAVPNLEQFARLAIQTGSNLIPLDSLLANIQHNKPPSSAATNINMAPPTIFYSNAAAVLVVINGKPMLADTSDNSGLQVVINTNWQLFQQTSDKSWYLLNGQQWLTASRLSGPWRATTDLPAGFLKLPDTETWQKTREEIPPRNIREPVPRVFISQKPAELIYVDGKPKLERIRGTGLEYVENTESTVFMQEATGDWYFLVSGRWFTAKQLAGPWTTVNHLPAGFANIPPDSDKASVLSSVPGTAEARLAVMEAQIPQTATVMFTTRPPDINYSGEPIFKPIDGTSLEFAVNTQAAVIKDSSAYFYVYDGVWFTGRSPNGPWGVATSIPSEIYAIPPESPLYYVTFVDIYDSDDDSVTVGYTAGYNQTYVVPATTSTTTVNMTVVYGTGYWYNPWLFYNPYLWYPYPVYWAYPYTYGWNAGYNPATGRYYGYGRVYGPYGGAGYGYRYNPTTGAFAQGHFVYGPYAAAGGAHGFNPVTNTGFATHQVGNGYQSWGNTVVAHNGNWVDVSRHTVDGQSTFNINTSGGKSKTVTTDGRAANAYKTGKGDVYASHAGDVYRRDGSGWDKYDNADGDWDNWKLSAQNQQRVEQAKDQGLNRSNLSHLDRQDLTGADAQFTQYSQLNRDALSREYGNQRYNNFQRNGGFSGFGGRRR